MDSSKAMAVSIIAGFLFGTISYFLFQASTGEAYVAFLIGMFGTNISVRLD